MIPRVEPVKIPKVHVYCNGHRPATAFVSELFYGIAEAEDTTVLATDASFSRNRCRGDMTTVEKRQIYMLKYPRGYELVWIEDPENHPWTRDRCQPQNQHPELMETSCGG